MKNDTKKILSYLRKEILELESRKFDDPIDQLCVEHDLWMSKSAVENLNGRKLDKETRDGDEVGAYIAWIKQYKLEE